MGDTKWWKIEQEIDAIDAALQALSPDRYPNWVGIALRRLRRRLQDQLRADRKKGDMT